MIPGKAVSWSKRMAALQNAIRDVDIEKNIYSTQFDKVTLKDGAEGKSISLRSQMLCRRSAYFNELINAPHFEGVITSHAGSDVTEAMIFFIFTAAYKYPDRQEEVTESRATGAPELPPDVTHALFHFRVFLAFQTAEVETGPETALFYFKQAAKRAVHTEQFSTLVSHVYEVEDQEVVADLRAVLCDIADDPENKSAAGLRTTEGFHPEFIASFL